MTSTVVVVEVVLDPPIGEDNELGAKVVKELRETVVDEEVDADVDGLVEEVPITTDDDDDDDDVVPMIGLLLWAWDVVLETGVGVGVGEEDTIPAEVLEAELGIL